MFQMCYSTDVCLDGNQVKGAVEAAAKEKSFSRSLYLVSAFYQR